MNFNFGEVLARAWQIAWKHKGLWWAGILVSLLGFVSVPISLAINPALSSFSGSPADLGRNLAPVLIGNGLIFLLNLLTIPVTVIAMLIPSLATVRVERGDENVRFTELFKASLPYFWRTLGLFLLVWVGAFVVIMLIMGCVFLVSVLTLGVGLLCMFPLILVLIPVMVLVYALLEQGVAATLVDNLGVGAAIQRAWEVVKKNFVVMAILSILIYLAYMIIGMIISIPLMIPIFGMFPSLFFNPGTQQPDFAAFQNLFRNMMLVMLAFFPLYAVIQGFMLAFMQAIWTLTYLRLSRPVDQRPVVVEANA
jgi:hypothetical protein